MEDWSDDARMIVDSARAIAPPSGDLSRIRAARGKGTDRPMMAVAGALGLFLMRTPEDAGGLGLGMRETCALAEVLGAGLVPEPILETIFAGALLGAEMPSAVAEGTAIIAVAWHDGPDPLRRDGTQLRGTRRATPADADLFAVTVGDGVALIARDAPGLTITADDTLDGGTLAMLRFDGVPTTIRSAASITAIQQDAALAHAAFLLGLSDRAFAITLDYLKVREQFGRPIGSFQALQHRATDMKIRLELLRAAIMRSAARSDGGATGAHRARDADRCLLRASETAMLIAREAVQMHGAMGITDEADISLFVRRAMTEANRFGAPMALRARMAAQLEDAA